MNKLFEVDKVKLPVKSLRERYLVPPFSILDTSVGEWLKARNAWEDVVKNRANNIRNEIAKSNTPYINPMDYDEGYKGLERNGNISTFDPFLCEILVRWFSRPNDVIYDPFAGGHVRGMISAVLGRNYIGVDINDKQVEANYENLKIFNDNYVSEDLGSIEWVCADSSAYNVSRKCNMVLMCPPYYNLEIYTDNPDDLSRQPTYEAFLSKYSKSIQVAYDTLEDDSFAVAVVEEIRDKNGIMYGFVPDTINVFKSVGFLYYNEMILENRIMSLGVRCPKYFDRSRKVGRHHQNVLVFFKGNPKNIEEKYGRFENDSI